MRNNNGRLFFSSLRSNTVTHILTVGIKASILSSDRHATKTPHLNVYKRMKISVAIYLLSTKQSCAKTQHKTDCFSDNVGSSSVFADKGSNHQHILLVIPAMVALLSFQFSLYYHLDAKKKKAPRKTIIMRKYSWKTPNNNDDIKKVCSKQTTATHSRNKTWNTLHNQELLAREKTHTHSTLNSFKWQVEKNKGSVNNLLFSTTHIRFIVSDLAPRHSMQFYFA